MIYSFLTTHKTLFSKWLLTVSLFFSLLSFYSYTNPYSVQKPQIAQTEWVNSFKNKTFNCFVFNKIIALNFPANNEFNDLKTNKTYFLIAYNRSIKTQFNTALKDYYSFISTNYRQIKTIPQSDKSAVSPSKIG